MISRKLTLAVLMLFSIITFTQAQTASGGSSFPPKPANKWQIGLNLGLPAIQGDLRSEPFSSTHGPAFGVGLNIRKGLGYVTSLRMHTLMDRISSKVHMLTTKHSTVPFQTAQQRTTLKVLTILVTFGFLTTKLKLATGH